MSDENQDECKYGHDVMISESPPDPFKTAVEKVRNKQITSLEQWKEETGSYNLWGLFGHDKAKWKKMKIKAGSQGNGWATIVSAVDKFDEDLGYDVTRSEEKMFIPPQSQLHNNFMQQRQQAEQRVKESMQSMSHLIKQKHLIEHDLRKMRTRVENIESDDEVILKSDFIELVDSAGGGQQAAPGSLDFLRNNNIYPSIVAEFQEMDSLDDLKKAENHEDMEEDGKLADLPNNMKAILKKKYTMYQKWKDMYGSEIQRKVRELNAQLRKVEKQIEETEEWLQPYIRDIIMINEKSTEEDWADDFGKHYIWHGYSSIQRSLEFICHKGLTTTERGELREARDDEEETHYRVVYVKAVHVNLADPSTPEQIQNGPSTAVIMWNPAIVCKHVYENIIKEKEDMKKQKFKELMEDYTAMEIDLKDKVKEMKEKRRDKVGSVRDLRNKIEEKVNEDRSEDDQIDVPIELSSLIRRVEDGVDNPQAIMNHSQFDHGEEYLKAIDEILETNLHPEKEEVQKPSEFKETVRNFTGTIQDEYYVPEANLKSALGDLINEMQFDYYIDFKKSKGYYTMK